MDHAKNNKIHLSLFERMQKSRAERKARYEERIVEERKRRFDILSGNLKEIQVPINLKDGEKAYYQFATKRYADSDYIDTYTSEKKKGVVGRAIVGNLIFGPAGAIIGGVTAGSRSKSTQERTIRTEEIDAGNMIFTNKRILFVGKEIVEIPYSEILAVNYEDVMLEHKERIHAMYIKYPSMLKGECYKLEKDNDIPLYYQGLMRLIGRDKSVIKESDVEVDWPSFESKEILPILVLIVISLVVLGLIFSALGQLSPTKSTSSTETPTTAQTPSSIPSPSLTPRPCADEMGTSHYAPCLNELQTQKELSRPLNATVRADNRAVYITNLDTSMWGQCHVTIGTDPTADNYVSDGFVVQAGQTVNVPWGNMANLENQRFNYYTTKPDSVSVDCVIGGTTNKDGSFTGGETHRSNFNF